MICAAPGRARHALLLDCRPPADDALRSA